jgi:pre-rRNA-processing protein TSR1
VQVADYVVLAMSSHVEVDAFGLRILGALQAQGCPTVLGVCPDLEGVPTRRWADVRRSLQSFLRHHFPEEPRVHAVATESDRLLLWRQLAETSPRAVQWREQLPYMVRWCE